MQKIFNRLLLFVFISLIILMSVRILSTSSSIVVPVVSENINAKESELTQQQVEGIVNNYLINNPQIIVAAIEVMQKRQAEELSDKINCLLEDTKQTSQPPPFLGNKDGDFNITTFYDYNCPYCKKGSEVMEALLKDPINKDVKILLRSYPRDANSIYLTQVIHSVNKSNPDKVAIIHKQLLEGPLNPSTEAVEKILKDNGINVEELKLDISNTDPNHHIPNAIKTTYDLASSLKINSVPTYIINGKVIPGGMNREDLQTVINEMRKIKDSKKSGITEQKKL